MRCASTLHGAVMLQAGGPPIDLHSTMSPQLASSTNLAAEQRAQIESVKRDPMILAYMGIGAHRALNEGNTQNSSARGTQAGQLAGVMSHAPELTDAFVSLVLGDRELETAGRHAVAELFGYKLLRQIEQGYNVEPMKLASQLIDEFAP